MTILEPDMFEDDDRRALFEFLRQNPAFDGGGKQPSPELSALADYVKILGLQYDELYRDREETDLQSEATYLRTELIKQYVKTKKQSLSAQLGEADDAQTTALLEQVSRLDALLNQ